MTKGGVGQRRESIVALKRTPRLVFTLPHVPKPSMCTINGVAVAPHGVNMIRRLFCIWSQER
jgi:hypothetical protein